MTARATPSASEIAARLHSASIHLLRLVRRQDSVSGVSPAQLSALSVLVFGGSRTLGDLARTEQVRAPTMSRLVANMEAAGLVSRAPGEADRRAVRVDATPEGRAVLLAARERRVRELGRRLEELPPADLEALRRAVDVVERVLEDRG